MGLVYLNIYIEIFVVEGRVKKSEMKTNLKTCFIKLTTSSKQIIESFELYRIDKKNSKHGKMQISQFTFQTLLNVNLPQHVHSINKSIDFDK